MDLMEPTLLKSYIDEKRSLCLIDVRQREEFALVKLKGAHLFPLDELEERLEEIRAVISAEYEEVVVYCRSGGRSEMAIRWFETQGITGLKNLRGGINAYATEADSRLTPY